MQVTVPRPDVKGRTEILNWYLSKIKVDTGKSQSKIFQMILHLLAIETPLKASKAVRVLVLPLEHWLPFCKDGIVHCSCSFTAVDAEIIARGTVGFSGAELENLVNQAALKAAVDEKEMVTMKELEFSKDKILMGEYT